MANTYIAKSPQVQVRKPTEDGQALKKSETAAATEEVAANSLHGMVKSGQISAPDAQAVATQLDRAIGVADQAEQTAKKIASPESQAEARKMATTREAGLAAALYARLPADQIQATPLSKMEAAQVGYEAVAAMDPVVTQMENIAVARGKIGEEIAGLEGKKPRTEGEELLLTAKRHQGEALDATSAVLRQRVDTLRATKDAALNEEAGGGKAINEEEAAVLAGATRATDVAMLAAATKGRGADAEVAMALEAVRRERASTIDVKTNDAALTAQTTGVTAPADGKTLPAGDAYTVQKGDWLTKIAANHRNADGSRVTLEQLLSTPGNEKYKKNPDLIHPGDVVKLPAGAVRADGTATAAVKKPAAEESTATVETKKPDTSTPAGKPRLGLNSGAAKPMDAAQINESVARSNAQTKTINDVRQAFLNDGVGGLDARVDAGRVSRDADAVIARSQTRLADVNKVGAEIDGEIKTLTAKPNRTAGEEALLVAKRAQRGEVTALAGALTSGIESLRQLKVDASDGKITDAEAKGILSRYQAKQKAITSSVEAGMNASNKLSEAYDLLRKPETKPDPKPTTVWV